MIDVALGHWKTEAELFIKTVAETDPVVPGPRCFWCALECSHAPTCLYIRAKALQATLQKKP